MQVVASMVLAREATPQDASSFLTEVLQKTGLHLDLFKRLLDFAKGLTAKQGRSQDQPKVLGKAPQRKV